MDKEAVQLSRPASFTTAGYTRKEDSLRPWSSNDGAALSHSGSVTRARVRHLSRHRQQLTAARTEALQAYLAEQLTHLSGPVRETFESSILGTTESVTQSPSAEISAARRKRQSPSRRRAASKAIPNHVAPTVASPPAQPSADIWKSRSTVGVPNAEAERGLGATTPSFPQVIDRWPAHSSPQRPDDLGALRAPLSTPPALVVDDGMLFEDHSREARSPTRARVRSSGTDAADPAGHVSAAGSAARSAMAGQLLRTAPKLLQDLEYYLNRELEENDVAGPERVGHPVRVRIIGECFDCFIEHCSTYKPLLANIKCEYEKTIQSLRQQVDSAQPKFNKLATLEQMTASDKVEQRVAHYQENEGLRSENEEMKARTWRLEKKVAELNQEMEKKNKRVEKYVEDAEADFNQNQALSTALQAAKQQNADSAGLWLERETLRQALDTAEKQLDQLSIRLDGAVPSDVHNALTLAHDQLEEKHGKVASSEARLTTKVATLEATNDRLNQKIESLTAQLGDLKAVGTPRPAWDPVLKELGAPESSLGDERSTKSNVVHLLEVHRDALHRIKQLSSRSPNDEPYFLGEGTNEDVLPFLRYAKGKRIRNKRMTKREAEYLVKRMLMRKHADDKQRAERNEQPTGFLDFVHAELTADHVEPNRIAEFGYNLIDACKRFAYDADIEMFLRVINGDCSEHVLQQQLEMLHDIRNAIDAICVDDSGKAIKGAPSKDQIMDCCRQHKAIRFWSDAKLQTLSEKLDLDSPKKGPVDVNRLFHEDSDGNQLGFVECLRDLFVQDREEYLQHLEDAICELDPEHDGFVNVVQLNAAVRKVDPDKAPDAIDAFIRLGLMIEQTEEVASEQSDVEGNAAGDGPAVQRKVIGRRPCLPLEELPHEAVLFSTTEFMSLVRKQPFTRDSPAPT